MLLTTLFVSDVFTDVALGVELILNQYHFWGYCVLGLVVLPNAVSLAAEVLRACLYGGFCCCCCCLSPHDFAKPSNWMPLFTYHLYTAFMLSVGRFRPAWRHLSVYLRSIHGFFQSSPQLVLQLVILAKGVRIHSLDQTIEQLEEHGHEGFLEYLAAKPWRWYWGLIQVYSLGLSFLSVLQTAVQFNEWEKRRHTLHRMLLVVPFFAVTILYRAFAIGFLICMAGMKLSALPILALALAQVISFRNLGLDLPRCLVYGGLCSFLAPSGYSRGRDPLDQPLGMALVKQRRRRCQTTRADLDEDEKSSSCCCCGDSQEEEHYWVGDRTPEQVNALRERTRFYLAMHVIFGGGILGICLTVVGFLLNFTNFYPTSSQSLFCDPRDCAYIDFSLDYINEYVFPGIAILFLVAVILTRTFSCCIGRCFEEEYIYPI